VGLFTGRRTGGSFKFRRIISGRNSFVPIIVGRVTQDVMHRMEGDWA
jgi:hypothetical protein